MAYDHYLETKNLIIELRKYDLDDYSNELKNAMESGSTATEILMAIRFLLNKLIKEESVNDSLNDQISALLRELNLSLD